MRSDREHCASRVAVEQEEERRGGEEQATDIKSNNPHLAGGEIRDKALYRGLSLGLVMEVIIHNLGALDLAMFKFSVRQSLAEEKYSTILQTRRNVLKIVLKLV